jgi:hypothetical protein
MAPRISRKLLAGAMVTVVAAAVVAATALSVSDSSVTAPSGSSELTSTPKPAPPDLTQLLTSLTSSDPVVQDTGLAPALRTHPGSPNGLLPIGSTLAVSPETWEVIGRDRAGEPYLAKIQAALIRPGQPIETASLHLVHLDEQWLLYETSTL